MGERRAGRGLPGAWKHLLPWLKGGLGLGLLVTMLLAVDWPRAAAYLRAAERGWLGLGLGVAVLALGLKALRWGQLLRLVDVRPPGVSVLEAYLAGQALNILLPFRGGEVARLGMIGAALPSQVPESASSIVAEKALDGLALLGLAGALFLALPPEGGGQALSAALPRLGALLILLGGLLALGLVLWPSIAARLDQAKLGRLTPAIRRVSRLILQWRALVRQRRSLPTWGVTFAIWILMWAENLVMFRSVGIQRGGAAAGLVLALLMVGLLPAVAPGNIGPFHFFATLALVPFSVPFDQALAFAILLHAVVTLPPLLLGGAVLLWPGRRRRQGEPIELLRSDP